MYSEETIGFFDRLLFPNNGKSESESREQSSMRLTCNDSNGFQTSSSLEPRASSPSHPRWTSRVNWTRGRRKSRPRRQRLLPRRRHTHRRGTTPRIRGGTGLIGGRKRRRFVRSFAFLARALLESWKYWIDYYSYLLISDWSCAIRWENFALKAIFSAEDCLVLFLFAEGKMQKSA